MKKGCDLKIGDLVYDAADFDVEDTTLSKIREYLHPSVVISIMDSDKLAITGAYASLDIKSACLMCCADPINPDRDYAETPDEALKQWLDHDLEYYARGLAAATALQEDFDKETP